MTQRRKGSPGRLSSGGHKGPSLEPGSGVGADGVAGARGWTVRVPDLNTNLSFCYRESRCHILPLPSFTVSVSFVPLSQRMCLFESLLVWSFCFHFGPFRRGPGRPLTPVPAADTVEPLVQNPRGLQSSSSLRFFRGFLADMGTQTSETLPEGRGEVHPQSSFDGRGKTEGFVVACRIWAPHAPRTGP